MSGIAGYIGKEAAPEKVEQMIQAIKHRGLKGPIIKAVSSGVIGFVGNSHGLNVEKSPFVLIDGALFRDDHKKELSDADYLRELYLQYGKEALSKICGSFACAIIDKDECIIARDHVGARPVIYYESPHGELLFASEAKALRQITENVEELPPGYYYSTKEGCRKFNDFPVSLPEWDTPEEAIRNVREVLIQAVEQALDNGNIEGVGLSGGLDSSIVLAIARQYNKNIQAFTATMADHSGKDLPYARLLTEYLGVEHHIYEITPEDIKKIIPESVWYLESFDEDCIVGFIANYYTSHLASQHVNSVLVGEGADELFGGYFRELKDISDPAEKERIGRKLVEIAYNTALRRLDRGWMSNSVEYFAPFLHPAVVALSHKLPMELKVYQQGNGSVEKWILREAFRDLLPPEIADRPKLRFSRGVGVEDQVDRVILKEIGEEELQKSPKSRRGITLRSPKEFYFYKLFQNYFPDGYEGLTARWDPFK